jgi:hypothetical protein
MEVAGVPGPSVDQREEIDCGSWTIHCMRRHQLPVSFS